MNLLIAWPKSVTALEEGSFWHLNGKVLPSTEPQHVILLPAIKSIVHIAHSSWIPSTVENVMSLHGRGRVSQRRLRCNVKTDDMELCVKVLHREWDPMVGCAGARTLMAKADVFVIVGVGLYRV